MTRRPPFFHLIAMPIFAYRCDGCGFAQDVLQKRSDPPLEICPSCSASSFRKQLTAPAFQLKGSGWYVTDFRDNGKTKPSDKPADKPAETGGESADRKPAEGAPAPAAAPAPAPTPPPAASASPSPAPGKSA